jgi:hypothetical protein
MRNQYRVQLSVKVAALVQLSVTVPVWVLALWLPLR